MTPWLQIVRTGASRFVVLAGSYAFKVPHWHATHGCPTRRLRIAQGRRCNLAERKLWPSDVWTNLCPIVLADRCGWIVVMPRARPMGREEFDEWEESDEFPDPRFTHVPFEKSHKDAGGLPDGRRVMIDYGMDGYDPG